MKTYTFPDQEVIAGTLSFEVKTSEGSGSQVLADKYFSTELNIVDETEFLGGDLQSAYADVIVENDIDNLFSETIVNSTGGLKYTRVKISLDGNPKFVGVIEPTTIGDSPFYTTNDALDGSKTKVTFRCIWCVSLLKQVSKFDYWASIPSDQQITIGQYKCASISSLITTAFQILQSQFGITSSVNFDLIDYNFYTTDSEGVANNAYQFPASTARANSIYDVQDSLGLSGIYVLLPIDNTGADNGLGIFSDSVSYGETAYEFLISLFKSLGLYCFIDYSTSYDLVVRIGTRLSGSQINLIDTLSVENTPFSELSRDQINVTSKTSGNSYVKVFNNIGTSQYSDQLIFDFHNDLDFPGTDVNSQYSLVYPVASPSGGTAPYFMMIRELGLGQNKLLNPNFETDLLPWVVDSGSWSHSGLFGGTARASLVSTSEQELSQTVSTGLNDWVILSARFRQISVAPITVTITLGLYAGSTLIASDVKTLSTNSGSNMFYLVFRGDNQRRRGITEINKVSIKIQSGSVGTGSDFIYMDNVRLLRNREGTPELVGLQIQDYFNNGDLSRKKITVNGALSDVKIRDYTAQYGDNFYIKKNGYRFREHETELEAINYPY